MVTKRQACDSDRQARELWLIEPLIPAAKPGGRWRDSVAFIYTARIRLMLKRLTKGVLL
jgi:hypothetical protein